MTDLLQGGSIALILKIAGAVSWFLFTLLITRRLGSGAMGNFAVYLTLLSMLSMMGRMGFDLAIMRFVAQNWSDHGPGLIRAVYGKVLKVVVPVNLAICAVLFLSSGFVAERVFGDRSLAPFIRAVAPGILPFVLLGINMECFRGTQNIAQYSFLMHVSVPLFASFVLTTCYLLIGSGGHSPFVAHLTALCLALVASQILWDLKFRHDGTTDVLPTPSWRELFRTSIPMLLASIQFQILGWTDILMLRKMTTEDEVGIYSVAVRLAMVVTMALLAMNTSMAPRFAGLYSSGKLDELRRVIRRSTQMIFWAAFPVALVLLLLPAFILGIFGVEFKEGALALVLLTGGQFVNAACGSVGYILQMTGRQTAFQNIMIVTALVNIVLNILLIPVWGKTGAALASLISSALWNGVSVILIKRHLGVVTVYIPGLGRTGT